MSVNVSHKDIFKEDFGESLGLMLIICDLHLGGFEGFTEAYPELCYISASNHLSAEEPVVTGRVTPAYDQVSRHQMTIQNNNNNNSSLGDEQYIGIITALCQL